MSLPHSAEYERCVLACLMCGADDARLRPEHFHFEVHKDYLKAIRSIQQETPAGEPLDYILLHGRLMTMTNNVWATLASDLKRLMESVPHACHVKEYANQVLQMHERRVLVKLGRRIIERAEDLRIPVQETWDKLAVKSTSKRSS